MDLRSSRPLVTIGIPTRNRAEMLERALKSALQQDYENIEVIVSDNASTDETQLVVRASMSRDVRVRYYYSPSNVGSTRNFNAVLGRATGDFFMWLGDDDWIDKRYVRLCIAEFMDYPELALVTGSPKYYRSGQHISNGKVFDLQQEKWWLRVISYYMQVVDNGMFYGVMRSTHIKAVGLPNAMGNDWLTVASIASLGKTRSLCDVSIHRELGGASSSPARIASALGLPAVQGKFPVLALATHACWHTMRSRLPLKKAASFGRILLGAIVFCIVVIRHGAIYARAARSAVRSRLEGLRPN